MNGVILHWIKYLVLYLISPHTGGWWFHSGTRTQNHPIHSSHNLHCFYFRRGFRLFCGFIIFITTAFFFSCTFSISIFFSILSLASLLPIVSLVRGYSSPVAMGALRPALQIWKFKFIQLTYHPALLSSSVVSLSSLCLTSFLRKSFECERIKASPSV